MTLARDLSPQDKARKRIRDAGYFVKRIQRVFEPDNGYSEVLFLGRESGKHSATAEPLTAYLPDDPDADALISAGW